MTQQREPSDADRAVQGAATEIERALDHPEVRCHREHWACAVGVMRLSQGLSPEVITARLKIDAAYYERSIEWFLARAREELWDPSRDHLRPDAVRDHLAGLGTPDGISVARHLRMCPACAEHVAALLLRAQRLCLADRFQEGAAGAVPLPSTHHEGTSIPISVSSGRAQVPISIRTRSRAIR